MEPQLTRRDGRHVGVATPSSAGLNLAPFVVDLGDVMATRPGVAGAKAAALARARAAGMPVLPGFVITTVGGRALAGGRPSRVHAVDLHDAWRRLSDTGRRPLVVRSSSTVEDGGSQSMAGMFTSVLDVRGWEDFLEAVDAVIRSGGDAPIAVLVQPFLQPAWGGVMFGADPVTGRSDRLVVAAVPGGPDRLVSGEVDGVQLTLSTRGRVRAAAPDVPAALRKRRTRRRLARLARRAADLFGGPQDIEWAIDAGGEIVMLQSRPITAIGDVARASGPVLGPGPVAETFGLPLKPLEEDLWIPPLRAAIRESLVITRAAPGRRVRESPVVVTVGGRVAADLELLGVTTRRRSVWARLDPRPPARRLSAAWRVGRLRVALPALAADLIATVDDDLRSLPPLRQLSSPDLVRVLQRSGQTLTALHGHEVLTATLLADADDHPTAASAALRVLSSADRASMSDEELIAHHPVVLSLLPPQIGGASSLPAPPATLPAIAAGAGESVREALRLRVRWVHELTARAALELGRRLVDRGVLTTAATVSRLRLGELIELVATGGSVAVDLRRDTEPGPPLPASFRLTDDGIVVPVGAGQDGVGRGAGGGRGSGPVHIGTEVAPEGGDVLVVRTLDPALAPLLPGLGGLVAETGSVLSHLAILAREYGVPTVVGLAGATERLAEGAWVLVDGTSGDVSELESREWGAA
jgi:pyruvate,water dikinase